MRAVRSIARVAWWSGVALGMPRAARANRSAINSLGTATVPAGSPPNAAFQSLAAVSVSSPYQQRTSAALVHTSGQCLDRRTFASSAAINGAASVTELVAAAKWDDPHAVPIAEALAKIAEAEGDSFNASDGLTSVLLSLKIRTLAALLDCGSEKWAEIERAAGPAGSPEAKAVLQLKAAVASVGHTLTELQKKGLPVPINPALIGKEVKIIEQGSDAAEGIEREYKELTKVFFGQLPLEQFLAKKGMTSLKLVAPLEIGVEHEPSKYSELVRGGVYAAGESALLRIADLERFNRKSMAVMEADVEKAIVAARGAGAYRVPFAGKQREVHFRAVDDDDRSPYKGQLIMTKREIDILVKTGDGLVIGECKHSVSLADLDVFYEKVQLLRSAVRAGNMLDTTLLQVWPEDERQLELVVAAADGWDVPYCGLNPRKKAKKLGIKIIEHNGAQWGYSG